MCVRVVLLDFDGTVIDTMKLYAEKASILIAGVTGMDPHDVKSIYLRTAGMAFRDQLRVMGVEGPVAERVAVEFEEWKKRLLRDAKLDDTVVWFVNKLRAMGLKVYLSTNNECNVVAEAAHLTRVFDGVLCYDSARRLRKGKPHVNAVVAAEGVGPDEIVFIGDGDHDIEVYSRVGVKTLRTEGLWKPHEAQRLLREVERLAGCRSGSNVNP